MSAPVLDISVMNDILFKMMEAPTFEKGIFAFTSRIRELNWPIKPILQGIPSDGKDNSIVVYGYLKRILTTAIETNTLPSVLLGEDTVIVTIDE